MKKILIVDDDHKVRATISKILKAKGYQTDEASSGKEAIEKATSKNFDIVLLDLMMPTVSGMDVLVELRKSKPKTKEIMMTGFATVNNAVEAIKKGASDYISKPFQAEELDATIRRCLEEARFDISIKKLDLDFTLSSLSSPIRRKIVKLLFQNNGMHLMELTRALDIEDHTKVIFHLKMRIKESLIFSQRKGKRPLTVSKF
jgi:DNA-binding NtrC family response regulator